MTASSASVAHDAHVHLWSNPPPFPAPALPVRADAASLLSAMDDARVGIAAVITPGSMGWDNSFSLAAARAHPDRIVAVLRVDIDSRASASMVDDEFAAGARGIRVSLPRGGGPDGLLGPAAEQVWAVVAQARRPVAMHVMPDQLVLVADLARAHPELTLLVDHLGRPDVAVGINDPAFQAVLALADHANVMVKTPNAPFFSAVGPPYGDLAGFIRTALDAFGAGRLVWGSDWPMFTVSAGYGSAMEPTATVLASRSDEERRLVLGGNFEKLYVNS